MGSSQNRLFNASRHRMESKVMEQGTLNRVSEERITDSAHKNAGFLLTQSGVLHHLGFVVKSISTVADEFAASMSARWDGEIIHDPIQRVRVAFFYSGRFSEIRCTNWWSRRAKIRQSQIS